MSRTPSVLSLAHAVIGVLVVGCAAPTAVPTTTASRPPLPEDLRSRQLYEHTHYFKYDLSELVGTVLTQPSGQLSGAYSRGPRLVPPQFTPPVTIIQDGILYTAKIDRGAALEGSVLAFAASLARTELVEVVFQDIARAFVPGERIPTKDILAWAIALADSDSRSFYVQGVVLSTVQKTYYDEVDSSASSLTGDLFRGSGRVYSRREALSRDFQIAVELLDLAEFVRLAPHSVALARTRAAAIPVEASASTDPAEEASVSRLASLYRRALGSNGDVPSTECDQELADAVRGATLRHSVSDAPLAGMQ